MENMAHYKKGDALQRTGTRNLQTGTQNHKQEPLLFPSSQLCWLSLLKKFDRIRRFSDTSGHQTISHEISTINPM